MANGTAASSLSAARQAAMLFQQGRLDEARKICERALDQAPDCPHCLQVLGSIHGRLGDYAAARDCLTKALERQPGNASILNNLGQACKHLRDWPAARRCFEKVVAMIPEVGPQPVHVQALAQLAGILADSDELEESEKLIRQALAADPEHDLANLNLARLELRNKDFEAVIQRMRLLLRGRLSFNHQAIVYGLLAEAYTKLGNHEAAFEAMQRANQIEYRHYRDQFENQKSIYAPAVIRSLTAQLETLPPATKPAIPDAEAAGDHRPWEPVFLLGFPRSGTTLLEQALSVLNGIISAEETDALTGIYSECLGSRFELEGLLQLTDEQQQRYRERYRKYLIEHVEQDSPPRIIIDKMPLNTIMLPLVGTLFPGARIIFALRDPRDAVISCFQHRFNINAAMFRFLRLDTTIDYYDAVMALGQAAMGRWPFNLHYVRYEQLVENFESTLRALLEFLEVPWQPEILQYRAKIAGRQINTPSAGQVKQPLYSSSIGKWRHYQQYLPENARLLDRWLRQFGYA